jgi:hypothetical protein
VSSIANVGPVIGTRSPGIGLISAHPAMSDAEAHDGDDRSRWHDRKRIGEAAGLSNGRPRQAGVRWPSITLALMPASWR